MSKKFKNKMCAYCKGVSHAGDHVLAREFFQEQHRVNLPKVPSCLECNNRKSHLEHYLATLLPFGGQHSNAKETLTNLVPKRLQRNKKLHQELVKQQQKVLTEHNGSWRITTAFPFNGDKIIELCNYLIQGL